ncbi:major facilitator superfamily domain-containing protein [Aspergillus egyptiacus]|nr:major facilitator superfamily domain-containing protein [Aspergillus egyptiacus]
MKGAIQDQVPEAQPQRQTRDPADAHAEKGTPTEPQHTSDSTSNPEPQLERWNHPRSNIFKTLATFWAFLVMGANDSAYGPLIPYLETYYNLSYTTVSLVFLSPIAGYTLAALTNHTLHARVGRRGIALLSPSCHLLAYIVNCLHPPYPVLVVSFVFAGLGNGLADSAWNAWIGNMENSNQVLGLLHGWYGVGATVTPVIATGIITGSSDVGWWGIYYVLVGCAAIEVIVCLWAFWDSTAAVFRAEQAVSASASASAEVSAADESETREPESGNTQPQADRETGGVRRALFVPRYAWVTWILAFFLLGYVGVEVALGGWIVTFLMRVRDGAAFEIGMGATGFWLGITVGRVVLGFVTPVVGEKVAISIYLVLSIACGLVLWLVPNFYASVVAVSVQGFFLGPMFPGAVVVATRLLPRGLHVSAIGFAAAFGASGAAVLPFAVGAIAQAKGVEVLQPFSVGLSAALVVLWLGLPRIPKET